MRGGVRTQKLDPKSTCCVPGNIQGKNSAATQSELAVNPYDQSGDGKVPQHLVKKGRLNNRDNVAVRMPQYWVQDTVVVDALKNLQPPGQIGGPTI